MVTHDSPLYLGHILNLKMAIKNSQNIIFREGFAMPTEIEEENRDPDEISSKLTFLGLASKVLSDAHSAGQEALTAKQIWECAVEKGYHKRLTMFAKRGMPASPETNLTAQLGASIKESVEGGEFWYDNSRPRRYGLSRFKPSQFKVGTDGDSSEVYDAGDDSSNLDEDDSSTEIFNDTLTYREMDMHPYLVWYAKTYMNILCKTIIHNKTKRRNTPNLDWKHPDIMGCTDLNRLYNDGVMRFARKNGAELVSLYSFELKKCVSSADVSQSFFQAVSNSSWANEGYLVTAKIADDNARDELKSLSRSFGIGVILIDMEYPDLSIIISPARRRDSVDWSRINELAEINEDVKSFIGGCASVMEQNIQRSFDDVVTNSEDLGRKLSRVPQ